MDNISIIEMYGALYIFEYVGMSDVEIDGGDIQSFYNYELTLNDDLGEYTMNILAPTQNFKRLNNPSETTGFYMCEDDTIHPISKIPVVSMVCGLQDYPESSLLPIEHNDYTRLDNNGYEYVDLDLPSGTLWATMNIGASNEYGAGQYFSYADTVGHYLNDGYEFNADNAKYFDYNDEDNYQSGVYYTKYNETDGKVALDLSDDAVNVNMGGDWKTPSFLQIRELFNATNYEIIQNYNNSGISCLKLSSKKDSNKFIVFPQNGYAYMDNTTPSNHTIVAVVSSNIYAALGVYEDNNNNNYYCNRLTMGINVNQPDYGFRMIEGVQRYYGVTLRGVLGE